MKIGYIQNNPIFGEKKRNFKEIEQLCNGHTADLIVLPELFATGYTFTSREEAVILAEDKNGLTIEFLKKISKKCKAIIVGGFIEKAIFTDYDGDSNGNVNTHDLKPYNSSVMVDGDEIIGIYRKTHLFNKEKLWFTPGDSGFNVYHVRGVNVGLMICFDWIFPESIRTLVLKGALIIAHSANLVLPYCQKAMITRSLSNRVYIITSNRIGKEERGKDSFIFTGASQIISTKGEILSSAPINESFIDFVNIDINLAADKNINPFNDILEDRRPEFYL